MFSFIRAGLQENLFWGVSNQVRHRPVCTTTEEGVRLEILDDIKTLISCMVAAQLIFVFVFAYAKSRFSHDGAHLIRLLPITDFIC